MEFTVQPYTADQEAAWDRFVMQESGNGTFLQTRNFLNYHPAGRFEDASLIVTNEHDAIVAVVPAAVQQRDGKPGLAGGVQYGCAGDWHSAGH